MGAEQRTVQHRHLYTCRCCNAAPEAFSAIDDVPKYGHICEGCAYREVDPLELRRHYARVVLVRDPPPAAIADAELATLGRRATACQLAAGHEGAHGCVYETAMYRSLWWRKRDGRTVWHKHAQECRPHGGEQCGEPAPRTEAGPHVTVPDADLAALKRAPSKPGAP